MKNKILTLSKSLIFVFSLFSSLSFAEDNSKTIQTSRQADQWYFSWGWNSANYSNSDIHFKGDDHDFTLYNVQASDRQTPTTGGGWYDSYLNPGRITIPQTNLRIGYFITKDFSVEFVVDHMKYVMDANQKVKIDNNISNPNIDNRIVNGEIVLSEDFLQFEHTDGLNYIGIEANYYQSFWQPNKNVDVSWLVGGGIAVLYPKSNVTLLDRERNDDFYVSGNGYNVKGGIEISFYENFFFRTMIKVGHIDMPKVVTSSVGDRASQKFDFTEYYGMFGYRF